MNTESRTRVVILTGHYRILGEISLMPGARMTDFLDESREFFAVTDAEVWDLSGRRIVAAKFLDVHRSHIEVMVPESDVIQGAGKLAI